MEKLRKIFVVSVMFMTVLSMSIMAAPQVKAASAGDLIKMDGLSSIYYLGADGKRYVFPNETTYFSWYSDFSSVVTVSQSELESYPLGKNVTIRPGTYLVKITTDPKVYAVEPGGVLVWIPDEETAKTLYGEDWAKKVVDVPDAFFTNYTISNNQVSADAYPTGTLVKFGDSADVYYIDADGKARKIADESAFLANRFRWEFVVTAPASMSMPELGAEITGAESALIDASSGAGGVAEAGTGLSVSLASDTPASATVPSNATRVVFTKFNVTASNDGDVTLQSITVKRTGVGDTDELSKVYIYDGDTRLTTGKTINSSTNEATFTSLNYTIPAGTTKTLSIVADIAASSQGNHALGIASASAITTDGAVVSGSFPIYGNTMSLSTVSVGKADVESSGSDYTRKVGEKDVEVASFTVYVDNTEDASFESITLYNSGRDIFSNLKLYRGSDLVAEATKSGDYFVFTLDTPYSIDKGDSASFTVKGDISGRDGDTGTLYVRYSTDVKLVGKTYGYSLGIDNTEGSDDNSYIEEVDSTVSSNTTTVEAGQLTISTNGPTSGDISEDANDVVLLYFSLSTENELEISKATINISDDNGNLTASDINDLDLVCGGVIIDTISAPTVGDNVFNDTWTIEPGTTECEVRVDIENGLDGDEGVKATLKDLSDTTYWTIKSMDGDAITDIIPSGDIAGNQLDITSASLTVNVSSNPAAGNTYVKGTSEAPITSFTFSAGDAADIKVTSIKVNAYLSDDATTTTFYANDKDENSGAEDVLTTVYLYDGDTLLGAKALTVGSDEISATFDGLSWIIPAGQDKTLTVKADVSTNGPKSGDDDYVAFAIEDSSSITAEYGSGSSITPTVSGNTTPDIYQAITDSGTLTMSQDSDTPTSALVVAGSTGVPFTKVRFDADHEAFVITDLKVINDEYATVGDDEFTAVVIEYTDSEGNVQTASKALTAGEASFTGLSIYVPKDDKTVITIKADLNTTTGGADNGDYTSLKVDYDTDFEAIGQDSGERKTSAGTADVDGNDMYVYKSYPTVDFADAGTSETLTPAASTLVATVNVTADAGDDITFENADGNSITFTVNASVTWDQGYETFTLKDEDGNILDTTTFDFASSSVSTVTFDFSTQSFTVPAGTTKQLKVYADTQDFTNSGDSLQLELSPSSATNIDWGIDGSGSYNHADIIFKSDPFGKSLVKG